MNSVSSSSHWSSPCAGRPGIGGWPWRWTRTSVASSYSSRSRARLGVERLAQPRSRRNRRAAAGPCSRSRARISGALRPRRQQPFGDRDERPRIFVRRRRVHQHRAAVAVARPGNSGGTRHRRPAAGSPRRPSRKRQGIQAHAAAGSSGRPSPLPCRGHLGCQASVRHPARIRATGGARRARHPHRRARAIRRAARASAAASSPSSSISDGILDAIEIDVPNRRIELVIGLDDGEARARHFALVAERGNEAARQAPSCRRRAGPTA